MPRSLLPAREGRIFAFTLAGGFALVGVILALRGMRAAAEILAVAAAVAAVGGLLVPRHLGPIRSAWMRLGEAIGRVTTPIVLSVIYFIVVTPLAVARRLLRRTPASPATYWRPHEDDRRKDRLQRQF
jgi:hypothetical protein